MGTYTQLFPPSPSFTGNHLIDLSSKVYLITGATSGVGLALAETLYALNATVHIGGRTPDSCGTAAKSLMLSCPDSKGKLRPFVTELADLKSVKAAVDRFLEQEYRLDVLFLNAGVMIPPAGSQTVDNGRGLRIKANEVKGFDMELGVNCLAPFLITKLLLPLMQNVATHFCHPNTSVRVVWASSMLTVSTPPGGLQLVPSDNAVAATMSWAPKQLSGLQHYKQTKAGVYLLAHEVSQRPPLSSPGSPMLRQNSHDVLHITVNPGLLKTNLQRHAPPPIRGIMGAVFKGPRYGAHTELYAGLAPHVQQGDYIIPFGRIGNVPKHVKSSTEAAENGLKSVSSRFYDWCEEQVKPFM